MGKKHPTVMGGGEATRAFNGWLVNNFKANAGSRLPIWRRREAAEK